MRFDAKRTAIDSIVATVLVVGVTLVASLAVGGFIFGTFGQSQNVSQVSVTGTALLAADFTAAGTTSTFTCSSSASGGWLAVTNTGTASARVTGVTITWGGANDAYTLSGSCSIDAVGGASATYFITFPATTNVTVDAAAGQTYTGTVVMSNGAQLLFTGIWQ